MLWGFLFLVPELWAGEADVELGCLDPLRGIFTAELFFLVLNHAEDWGQVLQQCPLCGCMCPAVVVEPWLLLYFVFIYVYFSLLHLNKALKGITLFCLWLHFKGTNWCLINICWVNEWWTGDRSCFSLHLVGSIHYWDTELRVRQLYRKKKQNQKQKQKKFKYLGS